MRMFTPSIFIYFRNPSALTLAHDCQHFRTHCAEYCDSSANAVEIYSYILNYDAINDCNWLIMQVSWQINVWIKWIHLKRTKYKLVIFTFLSKRSFIFLGAPATFPSLDCMHLGTHLFGLQINAIRSVGWINKQVILFHCVHNVGHS